MKTLETELTHQGRTLRQLKRDGWVAIYEVIGRNLLTYGYEVIIIKVAPAAEIYGRLYPERELYPSSSKESPDWGSIAWSYGRNQRDDAFTSFERLAEKQRNRSLAAAA
jgi:hypothetical protein